MKQKTIHIIFFIFSIAFLIVSQLLYFEGSVLYNIAVMLVLILGTAVYLFFVNSNNPIEIKKNDILFLLIISILFIVIIRVSCSLVEPNYSMMSILSISGSAFIFVLLHSLYLKLKHTRKGLSRLCGVIGFVYFGGFLICGILNLFFPGIIQYNA